MGRRKSKTLKKCKKQAGGHGEYHKIQELEEQINKIHRQIIDIKIPYTDRMNEEYSKLDQIIAKIKIELRRKTLPYMDEIKQKKDEIKELQKTMERGLIPARRKLKIGSDNPYNRPCTENEFNIGAIYKDYICSKDSYNNYVWRPIDNPGDIHNMSHRRRPTYSRDIKEYEQKLKKRNYEKTLLDRALYVQDAPYVRKMIKPRIYEEALEDYNQADVDLDEELEVARAFDRDNRPADEDEYRDAEQSFDEYRDAEQGFDDYQ